MDTELTEQERWEAFVAWLKENGPWIVGGLAIGAIALGGWRWWEGRTEQLALGASAQYEQIVEALDRDDRDAAFGLIADLKREYPASPYVQQAELAAASELVEANDLDGAAERLRAVMSQRDDPELALIARLRLARVQLAQNKLNDALETLNGAEPGAFAPRYYEVRGDVYYAQGDKVAALKEYRLARETGAQGLVDAELLDLKIQDLVNEGVGAGESAAAAASPESAPSDAPAGETSPATAASDQGTATGK